MSSLRKWITVLLGIALVVSRGMCDGGGSPGVRAMDLKDLVKQGMDNNGRIVEEDYLQMPSIIWSDYDGFPLDNEQKRSGKFKNYMLTKDSDGNTPDIQESKGPVIRSYIPRTSSKRVAGALFNWAFTPQQRAGNFYRSQAHLRPAAIE